MILKRYALACCVLGYMATIFILHALGLFPRPGVYDLSRLIGSSQTMIEGTVLDAPIIRWNQTRFVLEGHVIPFGAFKGRVLVTLTFPDEELAPGDRIQVRGWLSAPRSPSPGHDFDERGYWATRRVFTMLKVWSPESMVIIKRTSAWNVEREAWLFHKRFRDFWENALPEEEAALLLGITMGARGVLPSSLKEACIRAGVYHIVVVSGQNMSLIVGLCVSCLLLLSIPRRYAIWVCLLPVIFYTSAVGNDPPVVRAAAMALIGLFVTALGRDVPRYCPFLLAAGWILIREPEALLGASFQLSFGATFSILLLLPFWGENTSGRSRWMRWLKDAGIMGVTVQLGIWPLLVYYFHRISLVGFVANWTIFPLAALLMVSGLFVGIGGVFAPRMVPGFAVQLIHTAVRMTLSLILRMADFPWAVRPVMPPAWYVAALYYGFLFGILFLFRRRPILTNHRRGRKIYAEKNLPISTTRRPGL